jgi:hypothetical protein
MKGHSETSRHQSSGSLRPEPGHAGRRWRVLSRRSLGATVGLIVPVLGLGLAACGGTASSQAATTTSTAVANVGGSAGFAAHGGSGGGSNARSTNAAGGSIGTVSGVSSSRFTLSTPTGEKVTVEESSSTVYDDGTRKSAASAVTKGRTVLVLGKVNGTTITASQVIVQPAINLKQASANVISFKGGTQGKSKSVGQIPKDYTQGSGKLVSGTKATKATEAALASYAGGVVDRVVQLSNGDYEVHNIGVSWPHHVFVNQDFKVIGANS